MRLRNPSSSSTSHRASMAHPLIAALSLVYDVPDGLIVMKRLFSVRSDCLNLPAAGP